MTSKGSKQISKGNVFKSGVSNMGTQSRFGKKESMASQSRRSLMSVVAETKSEKPAATSKFGVAVIDEEGNDVTPKPLHSIEGVQKSNLFTNEKDPSSGTPTDVMSFASMFQTGTASVYAQPFSRSIYGSTNRSTKSRKSSIESSGEIGDAAPDRADITLGFGDVTTVRREEVEDLTEEDLNKVVDIVLEESGTIWLFRQDGISISDEAGEESAAIKARNDAYVELCKTREGNDRFVELGMQTFNDANKNKDIQAEKVGLVDAGVNVTTWDMYDTFTSANEPTPASDESTARAKVESDVNGGKSDAENSSNVTESQMSIMTTSIMGPVEEPAAKPSRSPTEPVPEGADPQWDEICTGESIREQLLVMERVVTENIYQPKQAAYRGMPVLLDPDRERADEETVGTEVAPPQEDIMMSMGPTLDRLWSYNSPVIKGRNASCMAWNKLNPDILAVGYGPFSFPEQSKSKGGLTCCWNLKNPEFPERVFHCKSSVSALDFSSANPNLLAVGLHDGTVCIYNVRSTQDNPVLDSFDCVGKHSSPVWQLKWVEREVNVADNRGEMLVSVAADGRVVQWSIRKGFECADLMKLKRTMGGKSKKKEGKAEAFISRQAPGMCFDFHSNDTSIYLAGTEEGLVHKCSCSYNEQFLDTYTGHTGSVYKVKWSPWQPDVFLSCSADWSIRLWSQSELKPVLNFFSTTRAVHDICWSPYSPTCFCAVNEGAIEIWDLNVNTLDPVIIHLASPGTRLSCCQFAVNSNSILVGDSEGQVSVYQLRNMPPRDPSVGNPLAKIIEATLQVQADKNPDAKQKE